MDEQALPPVAAAPAPLEPKFKTTAVVFAICFGLFSWLYTYKRDKGTFWILLVCSFGTGGRSFIVAWFFAVILALSRSEAWYAWYPYEPPASPPSWPQNGTGIYLGQNQAQ